MTRREATRLEKEVCHCSSLIPTLPSQPIFLPPFPLSSSPSSSSSSILHHSTSQTFHQDVVANLCWWPSHVRNWRQSSHCRCYPRPRRQRLGSECHLPSGLSPFSFLNPWQLLFFVDGFSWFCLIWLGSIWGFVFFDEIDSGFRVIGVFVVDCWWVLLWFCWLCLIWLGF